MHNHGLTDVSLCWAPCTSWHWWIVCFSWEKNAVLSTFRCMILAASSV